MINFLGGKKKKKGDGKWQSLNYSPFSNLPHSHHNLVRSHFSPL